LFSIFHPTKRGLFERCSKGPGKQPFFCFFGTSTLGTGFFFSCLLVGRGAGAGGGGLGFSGGGTFCLLGPKTKTGARFGWGKLWWGKKKKKKKKKVGFGFGAVQGFPGGGGGFGPILLCSPHNPPISKTFFEIFFRIFHWVGLWKIYRNFFFAGGPKGGRGGGTAPKRCRPRGGGGGGGGGVGFFFFFRRGLPFFPPQGPGIFFALAMGGQGFFFKFGEKNKKKFDRGPGDAPPLAFQKKRAISPPFEKKKGGGDGGLKPGPHATFPGQAQDSGTPRGRKRPEKNAKQKLNKKWGAGPVVLGKRKRGKKKKKIRGPFHGGDVWCFLEFRGGRKGRVFNGRGHSGGRPFFFRTGEFPQPATMPKQNGAFSLFQMGKKGAPTSFFFFSGGKGGGGNPPPKKPPGGGGFWFSFGAGGKKFLGEGGGRPGLGCRGKKMKKKQKGAKKKTKLKKKK